MGLLLNLWRRVGRFQARDELAKWAEAVSTRIDEGALSVIVAGLGLFSSGNTINVGQNADNSVIVNPTDIQVNPTIQAGAALGFTSVQDVVEMYGMGAGHVQGVSATPGWQVLEPGGFEWSNALSDSYVSAFFRVVALVTDASLTGRIRLFDQTAGVEVATSVLSTSSTTDVVLTSANILANLIDGHTYQFQAEATGGVADAGFIFVRSAILICQL